MEQFDTRPTEIKAPLNNLLVSVRAMLQAGNSANATQTARIDENTRVRKTIAAYSVNGNAVCPSARIPNTFSVIATSA
jgi:hypothetical protein